MFEKLRDRVDFIVAAVGRVGLERGGVIFRRFMLS